MSKGLGRNKQGGDHDKIGTDVPRAGIKVAAGPAQGELPWKKIRPWKPKPKPTYMNKGGPVKKKKKGYNYGGMVTEGYGHGGMVKRAGLK